MKAADLIEYFSTYWVKYVTVDKPKEAHKQLLGKMVERVFIYGYRISTITLCGNLSVVLDVATCAPQDVV